MEIEGPLSVVELEEKKDIDGLIKVLQNRKDNEVRGDAAKALGKIGNTLAVNSLCTALLDDNDQSVRFRAAKALSEIGWQPTQDEIGTAYYVALRQWNHIENFDDLPIETLIIALRSENLIECQDAAQALGKIGDSRAVKPLINLFNKSDTERKVAAASALGQIGAPSAIKPLINSRNFSSPDGIGPAIDALGQIGGTRVIEFLITSLKDKYKNPQLRQAAIRTLGKMGENGAVEPLINVLKDKNEEIRITAIQTLGQIGDSRAVDPLITTLKSRNVSIKNTAVQALGQLGESRAVEELLPLLKNKDFETRRITAEALVTLYKSGSLDEEAQSLVLAQRSTITQPYLDERIDHTDEMKITHALGVKSSSDCIHNDSSKHQDTGIGVDFPV